jgi:flagellar biosynthesis chaperone FliJ
MAPQDVVRQLRDLDEERAASKRKAKESQIKAAILSRIASFQRRIKKLESEISKLSSRIEVLHKEGKSIRVWWYNQILKKKKMQLKELKRITPSSKSAKIRRMVGE